METNIFSKIFNSDHEAAHLDESVIAFSKVTGIPVTFYDISGKIIEEYSPEKKVCSRFRIYNRANSKCRSLLNFAGSFSFNLGEPYIFHCRAGLSNVAVPLITDGKLRGYFIAGPFIVKKFKSSTLSNMLTMNAIDITEMDEILSFISSMRVLSVDEISYISTLLYNSVISSLGSISDYRRIRKDHDSQVTLNGMIQKSKKERLSSTFPTGLAEELAESILKGHESQAVQISDQILERLYVICLGDLNEIKTMILWITASVIKKIIGDKRPRFIDHQEMDMDIINRVNEAATQEELSTTFHSLISNASKELVSSVYPGNSALIASGLRYIRNNYTHRIKLEEIAEHLHVNPSYFSALFSHEMKMTFSEYITGLRLEKARELLINTDLSIMDISAGSGFENQSYFCKLFKQKFDLTPGMFRKSMTL